MNGVLPGALHSERPLIVEVDGQLHRAGLLQLLATLRRVRAEVFDDVEGLRDAW